MKVKNWSFFVLVRGNWKRSLRRSKLSTIRGRSASEEEEEEFHAKQWIRPRSTISESILAFQKRSSEFLFALSIFQEQIFTKSFITCIK
jgi:hypothetical protein